MRPLVRQVVGLPSTTTCCADYGRLFLSPLLWVHEGARDEALTCAIPTDPPPACLRVSAVCARAWSGLAKCACAPVEMPVCDCVHTRTPTLAVDALD